VRSKVYVKVGSGDRALWVDSEGSGAVDGNGDIERDEGTVASAHEAMKV
jgi:hypothetical protein